MEKDLTVGKTFPSLIKYVIPLFGSILFQQAYNVADSFAAGRWVGTAGLAAVGNAYEITLLLIAFAFGLNIGTSVIVAKYFGAKDWAGVRSAVKTAVLFAIVLGGILMAVSYACLTPLLRLIQTPSEIFEWSQKYLYVYIGGSLFLLLYNVAEGIFSALGNSGTAFLLLAVSSVANVVIDILFVAVFRLGVEGVAWATFLCQSVSGTFAIVYAVLRVRKICPVAGKFDKRIFREILSVSLPTTLQQLFVSVGNVIIQGIVNSYGTAAVGGYSAAVKLNSTAITSIVAVGNGISNFTSQNLGAKKYSRIREGLLSGIFFAIVCALLFTAIYLPLKEKFIGIFMTDVNPDSVRIGSRFLTIVSPFYAMIAIKLATDGVLRGARKMMFFMISTLTDLVLRVLFSFLFSAKFGIDGLWWSWPIGWSIAFLLSLLFYFLFRQKIKKLERTEKNSPSHAQNS